MEREGRAAGGAVAQASAPQPAVGKQALTGGLLERLGEGEPLDPGVASRMGGAIGTSFDDVRIHRDDAGGALAREQGAQAFAIGNHIAFAPGRYQPGTPAGDELIAHELTHVVQQRGAGPRVQHKGGGGDSAEHEADRVAGQVVAQLHHGGGAAAPVSERAGLGVQRKEEGESDTLPVFHAVYHLDGDPFHFIIRHHLPQGSQDRSLINIELLYQGHDEADRRSVLGVLPLPASRRARELDVVTDAKSDWTVATMLYLGWIGQVRHRMTELQGWNPKARHHEFSFTGPGTTSATQALVVKPANAAQDTAAAPPPVESGPALVPAAASTAAHATLHEMLGDTRFGLDAKKPPWPALQQQLDKPGDPKRLATLQQTLSHVRPIFLALGAASHHNAYLPDIAVAAVKLVTEVRQIYETALAGAATGPVELSAADAAFNRLWRKLTTLYLERGGGVGRVVSGSRELAHTVQSLSGAGEKPFDRLRNQLAIGPGKNVDVLHTEERANNLRAEFMMGGKGSLAKVSEVVDDSLLINGLDTLLVNNLLFHHFRTDLGVVGRVIDKAPRTRNLTRMCDLRIGQLEAIAQSVEDALTSAQTQGQLAEALRTAGKAAVGKFQSLSSAADYHKDFEDLQSRIKTVKALEALAKVLPIMAIAGVTGGAAGAAVGGALESSGALVAGAGAYAAEVATFTIVNRVGNQALFGKNEVSLGEDLVTNALMMGSLKAVSSVYGKLFKLAADPKKYKMAYAAGNALTGLAALQVFAEMHAFVKTGGALEGDERGRSMLSNALMMATMALGGFLVKAGAKNPELHRLAERSNPDATHALDAEIKALEPKLAALHDAGPNGAASAAALVPKLQALWQRQLETFADAVKAEKDPALQAKARAQYEAATAAFNAELAQLDLQLAVGGIDVQPGSKHLFEPVRPGFVKFQPEGRKALEEFYQRNGGKLEKLPDGMLRGVDASGETFFAEAGKADALFEKPATGAVMGKDVYPQATYSKDGVEYAAKLNPKKIGEAVERAAKNRPDGSKLVVDPKAATAAGVNMVLEVPTPAGAAHVDVTLAVKPREALSVADAHAGDAGPARLELKHSAAGKWTATIEVASDMRPEDVRFALDHELNEAAEIVRRHPGGEPKGGFGPEMQAGVMKRGATASKPTAHDVASARELVDLWNDHENLVKNKSPNASARKAVLERAMEVNGLNDATELSPKIDVLRQAGAPEAMLEAMKTREATRVFDEHVKTDLGGTRTSSFTPDLVKHLLFPEPIGAQSVSGISGGHHTEQLLSHANAPNKFSVHEVGTPKAHGGTTYHHFESYAWKGDPAQKPQVGSEQAPGGARFDVSKWEALDEVKTTFDDPAAFIADAERGFEAWLRSAPASVANIKIKFVTPGGVPVVGYLNGKVGPNFQLNSIFPDAAWIP